MDFAVDRSTVEMSVRPCVRFTNEGGDMNMFEVCLLSPGGSGVTIQVAANSSEQAKSVAKQMYPRWTVACTRDLGRH